MSRAVVDHAGAVATSVVTAHDEEAVIAVERSPARFPWKLVVLALAGYLLFCHGCHRGDHDDELFVPTVLMR
ncbi:MAG: hypothetical protein AB7K24_06480 [Gemmataceae bacterium]